MENMNGYDILAIQTVTTVYNLSQFSIKITTSPSYKINPDHVIVHVEKYQKVKLITNTKIQSKGKPEKSRKYEIFNKSSKILTTAQETLLSKGFKFVPLRHKVDLEKLIADIKTWERRMWLREYFLDENEKDQDLEYSKF